MQATNSRTKPFGIALTVAFSLLLTEASAQQTTSGYYASPPGAAAQPGNDEIVELSPFEVDASQDVGYRATSTLAGSRISTNLKDVAASVTVVTKEFLDDIAAADMNDVLSYMANAEGTRDFTSSVLSLGRPTDDTAANPFGANRIRGLLPADTTRDYFFTINNYLGFDTYNLDQVTLNRGPNSVLAGLGSPAGIVNYSPQTASLSRNSTTLSLRVGSYSDLRATANTNIVAKDGQLAFRIAGVWSDRGFRQKPSKREEQRIYLATTYKPWEKTTLRASYELAYVEANNPNSITPQDDITQWLERGSPVYDNAIDGTTIPAPLSGGGGRPTVVYSADGSVDGFIRPNLMASYNQQNLTGADFWSPLRMNNNHYINLFNTNLSPSTNEISFEAFNISVDQEITRDLYANVAYVHEKIDGNSLNLFRSEYATYKIDTTVRLPDGSPNPHFGETFMQYRGLDNLTDQNNTNDVLRGTLTYNLDFTEQNPWFGRYRITGFLEERETETRSRQWNARVPNHVDQDYQNRYYLGGSTTSHPTTTPQPPVLAQGVPAIAGAVLDSGGTVLNGAYGLKSDRPRLEKLSTQAVAVQGYLWEDKIVGLYGYRKDKNRGANTNGPLLDNALYPDFALPAGDYPPFTVIEDETTTYGLVVHPLPWLSLHYNESQNFTPAAGKMELDGTPTPLPTGKGKDWGFSLNLFENKLNVKMNWYELTASGASADSVIFPLNQWEIPYMEFFIMPAIAETDEFQADHPGFVYERAMHPDLEFGDSRLNGAYTSDQVSEGLELEVTYNITNNWRLMGNVSRQEAKQSGIAANLTTFIEERHQYWTESGLYDYQLPEGGAGWSGQDFGQAFWDNMILPKFIRYQSLDGQPSDQLAEWRASMLTNYSFTEGRLAGFNIGGGARYIEAPTLGHPPIRNSDGVITALDLANPHRGDSQITVDAWIGYRTKIHADRYDLSFQLNVRDLFEDGEFRAIRTWGDGTPSTYRIVHPRTFYLTGTLGF